MSKKIIAEIRLANGEVGYYDDYSRIHLTISKPSAVVYAGTNCSQIKKSIKSGRLRLVSGSFEVPVKEEVVQVTPVAVEPKEEKIIEEQVKELEPEKEVVVEEVVTETTPVEEVIEESAPQVEEVPEPVVEAEVQEEKPRKRNRKSAEK